MPVQNAVRDRADRCLPGGLDDWLYGNEFETTGPRRHRHA